jgi:uncharacterized protein
MKDTESKKLLLRRIIREAVGDRSLLVSFSGGVDSSLLLWESVQALGPGKVVAVTAQSDTSIPQEIESAREFAQELGVEHIIVSTPECDDPLFLENPPARCYICKRIRYQLLGTLAGKRGGAVVCDGTQADDDPADRPGMAASAEFGIFTPLSDAGIGKEDVRELLRSAGFAGLAAKKAQPCLATRIPFGNPITLQALDRVRRGEEILVACGLQTVRLRDHYPVARIVTDGAGITLLLATDDLRRQIYEQLRQVGYDYITLDLQEYGKP